jgi:DNA-binding XRE family transcriptional regulator
MLELVGLVDFGKRLKLLRNKHSFSQGDMANILEISRTSYLSIEQGKRDVGLVEIQKIASVFQMQIEVLIYGGVDSEMKYESAGDFKLLEEVEVEYLKPQLKFDRAKCREVVLYLLESCSRYSNSLETLIPKLLYLCDFAYYENHEGFLSTCVYKKLPFGPLPDHLSEMLEQMSLDGDIVKIKVEKNGEVQNKLFPLRSADLTLIKASEMVVMNDMVQLYGRLPTSDLAELLQKDLPIKVTGMGEIIKFDLTFYREFPFAYRIYCEGDEEDGSQKNTAF